MRLRTALIGPGRSFRGGIAQHTTSLAGNLNEFGILVEHASWGRQFPSILRPGGYGGPPVPNEEQVPSGEALLETRHLHWNRPHTWVRVARRLGQDAEHLVIVVSSPLQMPAVATIARIFRLSPTGRAVTTIIHNVLPHERSTLDVPLMRGILRSADSAVVHSAEQRELAESLGATRVKSAALPFHPPTGLRTGRHPAGERRMDALAFIGFVRTYKGLDILIDALSRTKARPRLLIHGEFWEPIHKYQTLIERFGLSDRVTIVPGYATPSELADVLAHVDALVLPYRSGTGSQMPRIAFSCGVPAIATAVGDLPDQIRDGIDGLVVRPDDPARLAEAIDALYRDNLWLRFRRNVTPPAVADEWTAYIEALLAHY